ncbi:hypothetical protein QNI16_19505 [Cytophagaceae bacterium YF14B1]|uniref:Uncharacterized protein n=1 Tax=Xanthocytophaga flava TaxID=3048013 RepID=A0AAE3QT09_9BACT|nr:hypothetical protein [Xanthocytophaga flavus]
MYLDIRMGKYGHPQGDAPTLSDYYKHSLRQSGRTRRFAPTLDRNNPNRSDSKQAITSPLFKSHTLWQNRYTTTSSSC